VNRAAGWLSLAFSMSLLACAGVNPAPETPGTGGSAGGGGPVTGMGGGGGKIAGVGGAGVMIGAGGSECGHMVFDVNRKPVEIFLVLDRSASMEDGLNDSVGVSATNPTKWSQVIPALSTTIQQADPTISWGLKAFPEKGGGSCASDTVTTKIDLQIASGNKAQLNSAVLGLVDNGDGTPTGAAVRVATNYLKQLSMTDDSRKYILLATDGEPSCSGSAGALMGGNTTAAHADAVTAVGEAANDGFHTFVVGVATSKPNDITTLNMLAVAGLEPSADTRPGATRFFLASSQAQLAATLEGIVNPVASNCVFPLNTKPPVPDNIAVKVNGTKSPQDTGHADGWDYTDAALTGLQVYGSWCDMIKSNGNKVEITYGCLNEIIP
jgi:hypothetical protein